MLISEAHNVFEDMELWVYLCWFLSVYREYSHNCILKDCHSLSFAFIISEVTEW